MSYNLTHIFLFFIQCVNQVSDLQFHALTGSLPNHAHLLIDSISPQNERRWRVPPTNIDERTTKPRMHNDNSMMNVNLAPTSTKFGFSFTSASTTTPVLEFSSLSFRDRWLQISVQLPLQADNGDTKHASTKERYFKSSKLTAGPALSGTIS